MSGLACSYGSGREVHEGRLVRTDVLDGVPDARRNGKERAVVAAEVKTFNLRWVSESSRASYSTILSTPP